MAERPEDEPDRGRGSPAQGIMLALLLSAPVWLGLGIWIWQRTIE